MEIMKNMTPEEMKKFYEELKAEIDKQQLGRTWGPSPISTAVPSQYITNNPIPTFPPLPIPNGISPTDIEARGMYPYQEPEVDEQGTYYGYKVLHRCTNSACKQSGGLISPRYQVHWSENGELQADHLPAEDTMFGIHFTKRPDHPELRNYYGQFHGAAYSSSWFENSVAPSLLVKCALSGMIVETEQGFRAEHAQIIGVFTNGNWQSYQDYQERTRPYSRPIRTYNFSSELRASISPAS